MTATLDACAPRKRPRQARAQATVDAILEAAARILETEGLAGYTTNAVATRAGVSIGSLYQYFPNRDALTAALIARETAGLSAAVAAAADEPDEAKALEHMIDAAVAHQLRRPALARLLDFEERRLPLDEQNARTAEGFVAAGARVLSRRMPGGAATAAAGDLFAMIRGLCDFAGEQGQTDADALKQRIRRAVFGYLAEPIDV